MPWSRDAKGRQLATRSQTWVSSQKGLRSQVQCLQIPRVCKIALLLVLLHLRYQQPVGEAARRLPASNELRNDGSRSWLRRWDKGTWATQKPKAANLRIPNQEIRHQALHMGFSENIMPPNPLVNDWLIISFPTHGA